MVWGLFVTYLAYSVRVAVNLDYGMLGAFVSTYRLKQFSDWRLNRIANA